MKAKKSFLNLDHRCPSSVALQEVDRRPSQQVFQYPQGDFGPENGILFSHHRAWQESGT